MYIMRRTVFIHRVSVWIFICISHDIFNLRAINILMIFIWGYRWPGILWLYIGVILCVRLILTLKIVCGKQKAIYI